MTLLALALLVLPLLTGWLGARRLAALPAVSSGGPARARLHVGGRPLEILAIQAGTVSIRGCHRAGCLPESLPYPLRFAGILADPRVGGRLPIWCYVIVHPEGVFVVDAGATPSFDDDASWGDHQVDGRMVRGFLRLDVREGETLPAQMRALGLDPAAVRGLVLTHQHLDHTGSTPSFTGADVWTARAEDEASLAIGAMPWRWRGAARVRHVDVEGEASGLPFRGTPLTSDGRLEVLWTPGHTPGSTSVRLRADEGEVWFVGDATFRLDELGPEAPTTAMHTDVAAARALQAFLLEKSASAALLPSHDADVPARLEALGRRGTAGPR